MGIRTFVLVHNNRVISPPLTTTREYGRWFEEYFDEYTVSQELYMKSIKADGERVLESHPGTKIGTFFKNTRVSDTKLVSWLINKDNSVIAKIKKQGILENGDIWGDTLKVYTVNQLEFYIRSNIDKTFSIASEVTLPKQIKITDKDMSLLTYPQINQRNKKLF